MPTLNWYFDLGSTEDVETAVASSKMGDGYEVRASIGLNPIKRKVSLTSTRLTADNATLLAFLEARKGSESFDWTDAENVTRKYVCRTWSKGREMRGITTVTCEFEQVYE